LFSFKTELPAVCSEREVARSNSRNKQEDQVMKSQMELPINQIAQNPFQPRKEIDADELAELSASVRTHGILQPIVVRRVGNQFQLVAGERRLRAAHQVGLATVPVHVVDLNDQQTLEAALVENIQRSDLNPIEKAQGFKDYLDRFGSNHDQLARRLGMARSTITNLVNLLDLTPEVQNGLRSGQISEAHAKILKGIKAPAQQVAAYKQIVTQGLSVKAADALIRQQRDEAAATAEAAEDEPGPAARPALIEKTSHVKGIEDELRQRLAVKVDIKLRAKDKGQIVLKFESNDDFTRVIDWLLGSTAA
jgi:ParB family chromosome partitioning protein